ncbi:uncharacterized protein LOC116412853 [Galleria mellonella]|uniref:Uncharacterized protein LOC116412853 n=1 Tax=Galleria mellonella TaxID=7137 RepID=A0A6J3C070_GALME|nr:uncharacterized protein LOC116412853 [Galleria mellonella]
MVSRLFNFIIAIFISYLVVNHVTGSKIVHRLKPIYCKCPTGSQSNGKGSNPEWIISHTNKRFDDEQITREIRDGLSLNSKEKERMDDYDDLFDYNLDDENDDATPIGSRPNDKGIIVDTKEKKNIKQNTISLQPEKRKSKLRSYGGEDLQTFLKRLSETEWDPMQ